MGRSNGAALIFSKLVSSMIFRLAQSFTKTANQSDRIVKTSPLKPKIKSNKLLTHARKHHHTPKIYGSH